MGRLKLLSRRFIPLFLIAFGVTGLVVWPLSGVYLTATLGGVESEIGLTIAGLRGVERMLNDSYLRLEGLEGSLKGLTISLESIVETVNKSSTSILEISESLDKISLTLIQASEVWALRLISAEFAESLRGTGESLKELSYMVHELKLQELLREFKTLETILERGIQLITFLKSLMTLFSSIIKTVIERIQAIKAAVGTIKNAFLILIVDATLIHLSIALIGFTLIRGRLNKLEAIDGGFS
ncbi:MAG: hypothetical protein QXE79_05160 [Candidatus Bathyarchaeia archaeon]